MILSIIIPVYNVEKYLLSTIENVMRQNITDFELILVNDGSTDNSGKICEQFALRDKRIRVINQENAGVSAARNVGVANAKGKYIGFVDSDDLIEPNMYETLVDIAERENADIVQCRHNRIGNVQNAIISGEKRCINGDIFVRELFGYKGGEYTNQVSLCSKIYRHDLFNGIHFPDGRTYEDEQETYKLCLKARKIVEIPDELYHYVKRENSIITGISPKKMMDKQLALLDRLDYLPGYIPELERECARSVIGYSEYIMCRMYCDGENVVLEQILTNMEVSKNTLSPYMNKYEKIYFPLLHAKIGRRWVLNNDFEPIQKILARIKG